MSNIPMLSNHQSPRHQQESRFCPVLRSGVRCMSTSASASASPMHAAVDAALATDDTRSRDSHSEDEGPFIARPSSAASSHTSFVSSLTSSTQDDRSSQTSASHCGARIVQHRPSPISSPTTATCTTDSKGSGTGASSTYTSDNAAGAKIPRLTSRSLHKTVSGAEKMEEYLKRLNRGGSGVADGRNESATPTPGSGRHG
nr:uncharacterized protein BN887_03744 [Melanopsichium pennsylvanicum 4]